MSKFFNQDSSSETESDSDNEQLVEQVAASTFRRTAPRVQTYDDTDDEEDKKVRVVLSEKAKRSEEINGLIKQLKNAKKIRDVVKTNEMFEEMVKAYEKCKKIVEKEGHIKQYIVAISELEAYINELWNDTVWRNSASKNNATALSKLRQKIRKYTKDFEEEIAKLKTSDATAPDDENVAESGSGSEKEDKKTKDAENDESSSDDENEEKGKDDDEDLSSWSSSESSTDSSDSNIDLEQADVWKRFLKKDDAKQEKEGPKKEKSRKKDRIARLVRDEEPEDDKPRLERPKLFNKDEEITHKNVVIKLNDICSGRGRKGTDRKEQMENICELREVSKQYNLGPAVDVKILLNQIAITFDYNTRLNKCMKPESWNACLSMLDEIMDTLKKNENIEVNETVNEDEENVSEPDEQQYKIKGCVLTITDRMVEEFVKILQQCDAHGSEYVERLKDEPKICALIDTLLAYIESKGDKQQLCRIYLKKVENLYYKYDKNNERQSLESVDKLCKFIYTNNTDRLRTKAMLCHIYHNALHDRWFEARDLMLMSHLQESIENSDVPLQILYNRTMVQVGLCAFRVGNIKDAHAALLDIQAGNRAKELLAQGLMIQKHIEKSKEQEMKERQRLIPFHMHINLELIECLYLVSAMLIEVPYMCSRDYETKKRLISKQFHFQLKNSEKQPVVGPPENMREHVVAASRAMRNGDWRACITYLINEKMNAKVWDLMPQLTNVKSMLIEKVKEESLRTYLFRYSSIYESISIQSLAQMFDLPKGQVYSIISKMIINEELMASLDQPTQTVVMHRTEPTKLQTLALQLSEKITNLMDQTERMITMKGGEMGAFLNRNQQGQQNHHQQNQQHRGGDGGQGHRDHKQQNYKKKQQQDKGDRPYHHHNKEHHQNNQHHHYYHHNQHRDQREQGQKTTN